MLEQVNYTITVPPDQIRLTNNNNNNINSD